MDVNIHTLTACLCLLVFFYSRALVYMGRDEVVHGVLQHRGDGIHAGNAAFRGLVPVLRLGATGAGKGALWIYSTWYCCTNIIIHSVLYHTYPRRIHTCPQCIYPSLS